MQELVGRESQFIVATHSPILLGYPNARILLLDEWGYRPVRYEETEHYRLMRQFLDDRDAVLRSVFAEQSELFSG
jgi:predicted ATPase